MQIFIADERDEPTEGSTRGPRGPKKIKTNPWRIEHKSNYF